MKRLIREPLVHFLLLGAALFGLYGALNRAPQSEPSNIVVSAGQIDHLAATFTRVWQRPPTPSELKGLIDQYVKEEILSREAIQLGLDQNDTVIRRRLQQKMEFIADDLVAAAEPSDAELADYLAKHSEDFVQERHFSFRHVFLNPEKRGEQLEADAAALLADLKRGGAQADMTVLGDSLLLPREFTAEPQSGVASQFGQEFTAALGTLKPGEWSGPIRSSYGTHLVFVSGRSEGHLSALDDVREQVKRELVNDRRVEANRKFLDGLLAKYRVTIAWPKDEPTPAAKTASVNQ